jgi:hypothetical protein
MFPPQIIRPGTGDGVEAVEHLPSMSEVLSSAPPLPPCASIRVEGEWRIRLSVPKANQTKPTHGRCKREVSVQREVAFRGRLLLVCTPRQFLATSSP